MRITAIFLFFTVCFVHAQSETAFDDDRYLEDQIYINLGYNKLVQLPEPISQTGFSYGFGFGFIKDLPVNERRNFGFGTGLGYAVNTYYFNVTEISPGPLEDSSELKSNRIATHFIELPIELRFRTSTSQKYKFFRFYPGFKFGYIFATRSNLKQREDFQVEDVVDINEFNYGFTLSAGYNKWNLHLYYGMNELFSEAKNNTYDIAIHELRIGLIFYIY